MSKRKLTFVSTVLLSLILLGTVVVYSSINNVQNTYLNLTGVYNSYSYTFKVEGNTIHLSGLTRYSKSNCPRSINLLAAYVGAGFLGYQTMSDSMGASAGEVSVAVDVTDTIFERFISVYSVHLVDDWQYDQTCGVY